MAWEFRYQLERIPTGNIDGSGDIGHDVTAWGSEDGGDWEQVPGRHKTIVLPSADVKTVMDMPDSTGPEKQAKNAAYKSLFVQYLDRVSVPVTGWSAADLEQAMENNQSAALEAGHVDTYITVTLGQSYPVTFTL